VSREGQGERGNWRKVGGDGADMGEVRRGSELKG